LSKKAKIVTSIAFLGILHCAVIAANFLAPCDPEMQDRAFPFAPPTRIHWIDNTGGFHMRPFVYGLTEQPGNAGRYMEERSKIYPLRFFQADQPACCGAVHPRRRPFGVESPGRLFLLGSDSLGRDQFSRLLYGGRISLFSGLIAAAFSLSLGWMMGALAGYYGGRFDEIFMRGTELFIALPWLYCLLAFRAFLPLKVTPGQIFLMMILIMGMRGWARPARLIRGIVLSAKERNYVIAARGFGASAGYLLRRHVLPQTLGVMLTQSAVLIPQFIMAEVTLSFLGLGVGEPTPSWGAMMATLQRYSVLASYWWMYIPGLILIPVFLAYYVLADATHEKLRVEGPLRLQMQLS
jgi:peptide/nickel transport system permease protein